MLQHTHYITPMLQHNTLNHSHATTHLITLMLAKTPLSHFYSHLLCSNKKPIYRQNATERDRENRRWQRIASEREEQQEREAQEKTE